MGFLPCILFLIIVFEVSRFNLFPPLPILSIPVYGLFHGVLEHELLNESQPLQLGAVYGIAPVVSGAVPYELYEFFRFVQFLKDYLGYLYVRFFASSADVVYLTYLSVPQH